MKNETTYNYWCTDNCDPKNIKVKGKGAKCPHCNKEMKVMGISTSIAHIGTQESPKR
jgi:hypothetical protein